jgi:alpha-tubulin suppressor-like RCC1 family protein
MKALNSLQSTLRTLALAAPLAVLVACGGGGGGGYGPAAPSVTSITPLVATANAPTVFTVVGVSLPLTAVLVPQDGTCAAATGNTATGFSQQCTFASAGQKALVVPVGSGYSFTVNVSPSQYVKICNDGSREGTFSCPANPVQGNASNEWACTLDTLTNKMWEVKTNDNGLRHYTKQYTSFDDITKNQKSVGSTVVPPTQLEVDAATNVVGYANALNGTGGQTPLCGSTKWRVPTLPELAALVKGTVAPTIDTAYFPNTNPQSYTTITPNISLSGITFTNSISVVNFYTGNTVTEYINRDFLRPVRLVSEPSPKANINKRIAAGDLHTCGIKANGDVACWGIGLNGQLGDGTYYCSGPYCGESTPHAVSLTGGATAVSAGDYHTCALKTNNDVACWGGNSAYQLGTGGNSPSAIPVAISLIGGAKAISSGALHNCAIKSNGDVVCWGLGTSGQIGNGASATASVPTLVNLTGGAIAISSGTLHTCAIKTNGDVACWGGGGFGQLGNGLASNSNLPVVVNLPGKAIAIASGYNHTCAVNTNGNVACWGLGDNGQLGNGLSATSTTPVSINSSLLTGITSLTAGLRHTCAIKTSGGVACWGYNASGELGNGANVDASLPVNLSNPTGIAAISAGGGHTCAMSSMGVATCWGAGTTGQLGNGIKNNSNIPVSVIGF